MREIRYIGVFPEVIRSHIGAVIIVLAVAIFPYVAAADDMPASDTVMVAATISFSPEWLIHAQEDQYEFMTNLMQQERPVEIDTVPRNRLFELIDGGDVDCILSSTQIPIKNTFKARHRIVFKVELFQHKDADLTKLPVVEIGLLANLPKPAVPLAAELKWYPLRSIEQGVKLLAERRLDIIVADGTRVAMAGNELIISSGLPAVRLSKVALICRDTKPLRDFVEAFDHSFGLPENASEDFVFQSKGFTG